MLPTSTWRGMDNIKEKWGLKELDKRLWKWTKGPVSDFLQSVPGNVSNLLGEAKTLDEDGFPNTVFDHTATATPSIHLDRPSLNLTQEAIILNKKELREGISKISLLFEPLRSNRSLNLIYIRQSSIMLGWSSLLKFEDKETGIIYAWNGKTWEKWEISLLVGKIQDKKTTYDSKNPILANMLSIKY